MNTLYATCTISAIAVLFTGSLAHAQALFTRPDTTPNYAAYREVDECVAAINRLAYEVIIKDTIWRDTAEFDLTQEARPLPQVARDMGRRCLAKWSVDTLPLKEPKFWIPPFLMVDRDADAERWYKRLFDSLPALDRQQYFQDVIEAIGAVRPIRIEMVKQVYAQAVREIPSDSIMSNLVLRLVTVQLAMSAGDTTFERQVIDDIVVLIDLIPAQMKSEQGYITFVGPALDQVLQMATERAGLDSLQRSNDAFVAYRRALWSRVMDLPFERGHASIGVQAPQLVGDFWFSATGETSGYSKTSTVVRPVPGKINFIVFFQGGCHNTTPKVTHGRTNGPDGCWRTIAAMRRLKRAYPDAEFTIVTKTYGSLGDAPPLEPASEADTLAKYFFEFHRLPVTLVVTTGPFFRLPGLDQRRIDRETQNEMNYTFHEQPFGFPHSVLITDREGNIFYSGDISMDREQRLKRILDAVYRRGEGQ